MNRYAEMFASTRARDEGAFMPFVMLGDPDPTTCLDVIRALIAGGADALELGIPFSDPVADGPAVQAAAQRALAAGVRLRDCWKIVHTIRQEMPSIPMGLLVYANLVVAAGQNAFYATAADAGVDSILVADVPTIEAAPFVASARASGVKPVLIAPPNANEQVLQEVARLGEGFTYVVTRAGVTGADDEVHLTHSRLLDQLRAFNAPPPMFGFGISKPEHVLAALRAGAYGAISGSAVVEIVSRYATMGACCLASIESFVSTMKAATRN